MKRKTTNNGTDHDARHPAANVKRFHVSTQPERDAEVIVAHLRTVCESANIIVGGEPHNFYTDPEHLRQLLKAIQDRAKTSERFVADYARRDGVDHLSITITLVTREPV